MPGLLAENSSSAPNISSNCIPGLKSEESPLNEGGIGLNPRSPPSLRSPWVSSIKPESNAFGPENGEDVNRSPSPAAPDVHIADQAEPNLPDGDEVVQKVSSLPSVDCAENKVPEAPGAQKAGLFATMYQVKANELVTHTTLAQGLVENGGSEETSAALQEEIITAGKEEVNCTAEDSFSTVAMEQSSKGGNGHCTPSPCSSSLSAKLIAKKKPITSPRSHPKLKEAEKDKIYSLKYAVIKPKDTGKERFSSPKSPSPAAAAAAKAKERDKGKVNSPDLPSPIAATAKPKEIDSAQPKEINKEKSYSLKAQTIPNELDEEQRKAQEPPKGKVNSPDLPSPIAATAKPKEIDSAQPKEIKKEKTYSLKARTIPNELDEEQRKSQEPPKGKEKTKRHSPPPIAQIKRPPCLILNPPENPSPTENSKRIPSSKDKDKASPSSPISPLRSSAKASPVSPLRPLSITPPSSSEKTLNSATKTPSSKPASRFMEPSKLSSESSASANNVTDKRVAPENESAGQETTLSEGEKANRKVKAFFQKRRKTGIGLGSRKLGDSESFASSEPASILARENPNLGPFLLKLARQAVTSGDNPQKALDYATRAAKSYESAADGKPSLELVMSLHILAATHCSLGQFEEAIPVLQHSILVPDIEGGGQDHALAAFSGHMQLGDTFALLGRGEDALAAYHTGLEVQKRALGETDPRVGETCRYLAEAHTQAMQFDKAEELCQYALDIHKEHSAPASVEEATDRRLMGLICSGKGQYEAALEHLVLASMALIANGKDLDVATVDTSIGDTYVSLRRFDEAVFAYQKALTVLKASKGENHVTVASVYVSLAELYLKTGKFRESKTYCESALRIYNKQAAGHQLDEVASGLAELAVVYEALNEQEQALSLLKKALAILEETPGRQSAIAGVEAQIGVLSYMCGNYSDAHTCLSKAVSKLRASAEKTSALFGIVLNQMGLCCLHLSDIEKAAELFEESRSVLEAACGTHHTDTLTVYSNLAGAYDALGRLDDAISALQYVVEVREEELGTANPEVEGERNRLAELLKEAGLFRARRLNNTLALLMQSKPKPAIMAIPAQNASAVSVSVNG